MEVKVISNFCVVLKVNLQASLPLGKYKNTTSLTLFSGVPCRNSVIQTRKGCDILTLCYPASDRLGSHSPRTAGAARGVWYCRGAAAKWCTPCVTSMTGPIKNKTYLQPKDAAQDFDHFAPCTFLLHWNRVTSAKVGGPVLSRQHVSPPLAPVL